MLDEEQECFPLWLSPFYPRPDLMLPVTHKAPVVLNMCAAVWDTWRQRPFLWSRIKLNIFLQSWTDCFNIHHLSWSFFFSHHVHYRMVCGTRHGHMPELLELYCFYASLLALSSYSLIFSSISKTIINFDQRKVLRSSRTSVKQLHHCQHRTCCGPM